MNKRKLKKIKANNDFINTYPGVISLNPKHNKNTTTPHTTQHIPFCYGCMETTYHKNKEYKEKENE